MLGGGFSRETVKRGIELGADAIAVDGGSTDSGPYYLGTGMARTSEAAIRRDVQILLTAAREAGLPLIVTSCATAGIDAGVDWMAGNRRVHRPRRAADLHDGHHLQRAISRNGARGP